MDDLKLIGLRIKELRKSRKMSQEKLAELTKINYRTVLRIENGHTIPTLETLMKISQNLNCTITDLLECEHLKTKQELIEIINSKLEKLSIDDIRKFYKSVALWY